MNEVLLDALLDTLKLLPWLILLYIVIELLEHKTNLGGAHSRLSGRLGPLLGAATGLVPQCGFSVMAAKLFERKYITVGTLLAIFVSTSDEAFILLLSSGAGAVWLLPLIAVKIFVGVIVGYAADGLLKVVRGRQVRVESSKGEAYDRAKAEERRALAHGHDHGGAENGNEGCGACDGCGEGAGGTRELFLQKEGEKKFECTSCGREHDDSKPFRTYFLSPLLHALKIAAFILAVNVVLGAIVYFVTEERFSAFMQQNLFLQPLITSLVGLIPNCASSVVITETFLQGGIGFGALTAGLCANAGLGFVVLLKNTKEWKRNLALVAVSYVVAVAVGLAITGAGVLFA